MPTISYLTRVEFDFGAVKLLERELPAVGISRPLIVTDRGVVSAGLLDRVRGCFPGNLPVTVYDQTPGNPTEGAMRDALALYKGAGCDGIVAIGGGSSMDLAKAVALMATHTGQLKEYMAVEGGAPKITAKIAPVVAVPTTAGTGSEVGRGAVIVLDDGRKLALLSPHLLPKVAICDPELTLGLPPLITAGTGMDAVAHCVEVFISPLINPPAEAIALDGLGRAIRHIERAVKDGSDREARWEMMMAAMEGALGFQKGLGAVHAMSHPLGSLPDLRLHHGTLNAVVMPAVLRFNAAHVGDKYDRIRACLGLKPGADLPSFFAELNARIGLPPNLKAMGVSADIFPRMAEMAEKDHTTPTNPRPAKAADYLKLFEEAMG